MQFNKYGNKASVELIFPNNRWRGEESTKSSTQTNGYIMLGNEYETPRGFILWLAVDLKKNNESKL